MAVGAAANSPLSYDPSIPAIAVFDDSGQLVSGSNRTLPLVSGYIQCPLKGVKCVGNHCVAVGSCSNDTTLVPFVAVGTLNGSTWVWTEKVLTTSVAATTSGFFGVG